jgi:hypothetical protein
VPLVYFFCMPVAAFALFLLWFPWDGSFPARFCGVGWEVAVSLAVVLLFFLCFCLVIEFVPH